MDSDTCGCNNVWRCGAGVEFGTGYRFQLIIGWHASTITRILKCFLYAVTSDGKSIVCTQRIADGSRSLDYLLDSLWAARPGSIRGC